MMIQKTGSTEPVFLLLFRQLTSSRFSNLLSFEVTIPSPGIYCTSTPPTFSDIFLAYDTRLMYNK